MNDNMTIGLRRNTLFSVTNLAARRLGPLATRLSDYYGDVLGRKVGARQTLHLLNAQLAFVFTVFSSCALPLRVLCLAWLATALLGCRASLLRTSC